MKLSVVRYMYEPPALSVTPETEYESAILSRYWENAQLSKGMTDDSADGHCYIIRFAEPDSQRAKLEKR